MRIALAVLFLGCSSGETSTDQGIGARSDCDAGAELAGQPPADTIPCDQTANCPPVGPGAECIDRGCVQGVCVISPAFDGAACSGVGHCERGYCVP